MSAGDAYAELIAEYLGNERDNERALEQRGLALVSWTGVLVAVLAGVAAISGRESLPDTARTLLILAVLVLAGSAVLALACAWPRPRAMATPHALGALTDADPWSAAYDMGLQASTDVRATGWTASAASTIRRRCCCGARWSPSWWGSCSWSRSRSRSR